MDNPDLWKHKYSAQQFDIEITAEELDNSVADDNVQERDMYNDSPETMLHRLRSFITEMPNNSKEVPHQHSSYKLTPDGSLGA